MNIFITGGAGFIGSHLTEKIYSNFKFSKLIILDKLTYAGNKKFLSKVLNDKRVHFIKADLLNLNILKKNLKNIDIAINVAAESHVDNSFENSYEFSKTNTLGSHIFFECCKINRIKHIIHVSTDEVYGEKKFGKSNVKDVLRPTNPYSASKAAAEMIAMGYNKSFNQKITILRANNIYGTRQYPEKLIPKTILSILLNKKIPVHGNGKSIRHFLHVDDFSNAVLTIIKKKIKNKIINIGSNESYTNLAIIKIISKEMNIDFWDAIKFVKDRPFNDARYSINTNYLKNLGWKPKQKFKKSIKYIIEWYSINQKLFS